MIDIVSDSLTGSDYKKDEDPRLYVSTKTERGPLADDWISNPPGGVIMCSYKHVKVSPSNSASVKIVRQESNMWSFESDLVVLTKEVPHLKQGILVARHQPACLPSLPPSLVARDAGSGMCVSVVDTGVCSMCLLVGSHSQTKANACMLSCYTIIE